MSAKAQSLLKADLVAHIEEHICEAAIEIGAIDMFELDNYVRYIQDKADKEGKAITGQVAQFMEAANLFLDSRDASKRQEFVTGEFDEGGAA
jgi:hypothetical protein